MMILPHMTKSLNTPPLNTQDGSILYKMSLFHKTFTEQKKELKI